MNMPGFNAEASVYVAARHYSAIAVGVPKSLAAHPQLVPMFWAGAMLPPGIPLDFWKDIPPGRGFHRPRPIVTGTGIVVSNLGTNRAAKRTSRSHSHKLLNLLSLSFMGHADLKNNQNRINRFQRGAECAPKVALTVRS